MDEEEVWDLLEEFYRKDRHFTDGRTVGSMCTAPHPLAIRAHMKFIESNLGNAGLYPGTQEMEERIFSMLGEMLSYPTATGHIVGGGTEANITALWIARNLTGKREVIFGETAHFSFSKAVDLLNLEPVLVGLDDDFKVDVSEVEDRISDDTLAVVGVAGTTELGVVDPIGTLAGIASEHCYLHVDAAFGGFVLPFLRRLGRPAPDFDFSIDGVTSVAVDPHKMGLSTIPSGAVLFRHREGVDKISVEAPYLTVKDQRSLSGTRCSAAVASTYAVMMHLGMDGYTQVVDECMQNTELLARGIEKAGGELVVEPPMNIVAFRTTDNKKLISDMSERGWCLSRTRHPEAVRMVIMPHIKRHHAEELMADLEAVLAGL